MSSPDEIMQLKKLSECRRGEIGVVKTITPRTLAVSLMALGMLPGDELEVVNLAPFGGPLAVRVNGTKIALRRSEAALIEILPA